MSDYPCLNLTSEREVYAYALLATGSYLHLQISPGRNSIKGMNLDAVRSADQHFKKKKASRHMDYANTNPPLA